MGKIFFKNGLFPQEAEKIMYNDGEKIKKIKKIYLGINGKPKEIYNYDFSISIFNRDKISSNINNFFVPSTTTSSYIINDSKYKMYDSKYNIYSSISETSTGATRSIYTQANKILLIRKYYSGSAALDIFNRTKRFDINLNYILLNQIEDLDSLFCNKNFLGNNAKLYIKKGKNFSYTFYNTNSENHIKFYINSIDANYDCFICNSNLQNFDFYINAKKISSQSKKARISFLSNINSLYLNMENYNYNSIFSSLTMNYLKAYLNNGSNFTTIGDRVRIKKGECYITNVQPGAIFTQFLNFVLVPLTEDYLYIYTNYQADAENIKLNCYLSDDSSAQLDFIPVIKSTPSKSKIYYQGYYNEFHKFYILYGDPVVNPL